MLELCVRASRDLVMLRVLCTLGESLGILVLGILLVFVFLVGRLFARTRAKQSKLLSSDADASESSVK